MTHLINLSFMESKIPDIWRSVRITPIPKKSANFGPKSFRPIACSSALLKLTERVALHTIIIFSSTFSDPLQFAYKARRSTRDAVAFRVNSDLRDLDEGCRAHLLTPPLPSIQSRAISSLAKHPPVALPIGRFLESKTTLLPALDSYNPAGGNQRSILTTAEFFKVPFYPLTCSSFTLVI
uniref:Uncharacterized protein n=1 Tax=Schistocephalus solidus TaxID=70667 RepID=A0A0X3P9X6_SCHSO